jgi:hypothetical protein
MGKEEGTKKKSKENNENVSIRVYFQKRMGWMGRGKRLRNENGK